MRYRTWAEFSTAYRARWQQWPQWSAWLLYRHLIGN